MGKGRSLSACACAGFGELAKASYALLMVERAARAVGAFFFADRGPGWRSNDLRGDWSE